MLMLTLILMDAGLWWGRDGVGAGAWKQEGGGQVPLKLVDNIRS